MKKLILGSVIALGLASTSAMAQSTVGGGAAASGPEGSVAGGATAGTAGKAEKQDRAKHRRHGADRQDRGQQPDRTAAANSASTYGSGSVYTDRQHATGAVTAGGSAAGTGSQASGTSIDAYGSTDRNGSSGEVYGDSSATSTNPKP